MKQAKRNGIILALITLLVLYFVLRDNFQSVVYELQRANLFWILLALVVTGIYVLLCKHMKKNTLIKRPYNLL